MTQVKTFHLDREQMHTAFAYAVDDIVREARFHAAGLLHDHCWHRHLSWPMHDVQHCFDCAGSWHYDSRRMQRSSRLPAGLPERKGVAQPPNVLTWPKAQPGGPESQAGRGERDNIKVC